MKAADPATECNADKKGSNDGIRHKELPWRAIDGVERVADVPDKIGDKKKGDDKSTKVEHDDRDGSRKPKLFHVGQKKQGNEQEEGAG